MQISKSYQLSVWQLQIDRLKRSGRNLDELNECLWASGSRKQKNNGSLSLPCYPVNSQCLPRKIPIEKEKKKKKKTVEKKQTSVTHIAYNVKILPQ